MSKTIAITGWMLMTVMHSGELKTTTFPTEALCADGASLILTGKTVAEVEHDAMISRVRAQVDKALWDLNNPQHEPVTDEEWGIVKEARDQPDVYSKKQTLTGEEWVNKWPRTVYHDHGKRWKVFEDGTIEKLQEFPTGISSTNSSSVNISTDWITATRCVPIPAE